MAETITNLKVRFGAETKKFQQDMESGKAAVSGFTNQAGDAFSRFAQAFGINMTEINAAMSAANKQTLALSAGFKGAASGSGILSGALKILRLALISTGIGALIVGFGTLVSYFTKTQRGADQVKKVMASMGAIFSVLIDRASMFGEGLFKIFTGKFKEGWDALKGSLQGVGEEIKEEATAAWQLEAALQALEEREIALITVQEERRKKIEELRLAAKDETKSAEERRKAITDAIALEKQSLADEIALQKERVRILQEQTDLGESTRDDYRKLAEEQAKLSSLQGDSARTLRRLQTEYNTLTNEIEANSAAILKNRQKESGDMKALAPVTGVNIDAGSLEEDKLILFQARNEMAAEKIQSVWVDATEAINESFSSLAVGFGESLGALMSGSAGLSDIGSLVLGSLADLMIQVGKMAIQTGIAVESIKVALKSLGGVGAIAAGVALVALGSAIKGGLANAASGGGVTYSSNSSVYDSSSSTSSSLRGSASASYNQSINLIVSGEFKLKGKDLVASVNNETKVARIRS